MLKLFILSLSLSSLIGCATLDNQYDSSYTGSMTSNCEDYDIVITPYKQGGEEGVYRFDLVNPYTHKEVDYVYLIIDINNEFASPRSAGNVFSITGSLDGDYIRGSVYFNACIPNYGMGFEARK